MKFEELDKKIRIYESANDMVVLPGMYIVARVDGRGFTRLTKEIHPFEAPFDERFRDYMTETVKHLMNTGFNIVYGYTQSDEISLLFHPDETAFSRKHRKYISILAGEASARFSMLLGSVATFDCRLSELPNKQLVSDYFRWRHEDAHRNSLSAHCYWRLRKEGLSVKAATEKIERLSNADKNELLFRYNINFNDLPSWQKRGIGVYWREVEKKGLNPVQERVVTTKRRILHTEYELPMKDEYNDFVLQRIP
ncbi:tRNA(His) 5'-end guanylyltransferase [Chitinophaga eiseniae]|uniref:tRNA(His) guanylyltransferase n=1 Tax=Chitinophaga eiseniae TaxID=634771 RepID=A0A1T4STG9_9BACT|nr:tRNA(His) guanylyltransferase Thg1 family protein [Chitinophaga eiseniae]SKA31499.1 tRNA(His) 5'-end guanylyltransferase [Chitinophaga eiseniae]